MTTLRRARLPRVGSLTLRTRLTALYGTAFAVAGATLVLILWWVASTSLDNQPDDIVAVALDTSPGSGPMTWLLDAEPLDSPDEPDGVLRPGLGSQAGPTAGDLGPPSTPPLATGDAPAASDPAVAELSALVAEANEAARAQTLRTIVVWSVVALVVTLVAAVVLGWVMASRVLAPLHKITATARRVAGDSLSARIALEGPKDEIKDLADTFDGMLDRLDASFDGQRRFTANASHELRTPLTITRSVLEVSLTDPDCPEATRDLAEKLLTVTDRQADLIEGLLALASADLTPPELAPVDLAGLATQVVDDSRPGASAAGVRLVVTTRDDARGTSRSRFADDHHTCGRAAAGSTVLGDHVLLERLARNLVDNAVRYNLDGGTVHVSALCPHVLVVENSGPVVPESQVSGLFEPFRRLTPQGTPADRSARSTRSPGAGLGLSIVRSVAAAHGGTVRARPRDGGGLVVRIRLPDSPEEGRGEQRRR